MKLKRGQKLCKNCNQVNGARAHTCKHCGSEFVAKTKSDKPVKPKKIKKYTEVSNWKELVSGDKIKVIGRSGNYYVNSSGERQYLTDAGLYTISDRDDNGLMVYGDNQGFGYIYMGPEVMSQAIPNMFRSPHKIVKINTPIRHVLR
jgi:ribosomal protein L40E